jgi:hypothetical protein
MRIGPSKKPVKNDVERWAELGDHVLVIAREIQFRGYKNARAVPLTATEGMVMRCMQNHPIAAPNQTPQPLDSNAAIFQRSCAAWRGRV